MNIYRLTNDLISKGKSLVVISAVDKKGDGPVEVGKKMIVTSDNEAFGTVGGGALEYNAREYCEHIFKTKKSVTKTYLLHEGKILKDTETLPMACGGVVTLYYEYIGPNEYIYIFGAGHVSKALTKTLKTMNYHVTVIDNRKDVLDALEFADEKVLMDFEDFVEQKNMDKDAYIVVCTPSHKYDYKVIDKIFEKKLSYKYLGMLCSKRKIIEYLKTVFKKYKQIDLKNFYSPIGLNTGGGSPEEIAISISSEIMVVSNGKPKHHHMRESITDDTYRYWED